MIFAQGNNFRYKNIKTNKYCQVTKKNPVILCISNANTSHTEVLTVVHERKKTAFVKFPNLTLNSELKLKAKLPSVI